MQTFTCRLNNYNQSLKCEIESTRQLLFVSIHHNALTSGEKKKVNASK